MVQPCSFQITFDRADRRYAGGDAVRGSVRIVVNQPVKSSGIWLTHCWKTHGIGNQHEVTLKTIQLAEPEQLQAGQELSYQFEVTAPLQPLTQHGRLFSIDYYMQVHVSVAWATDPSAEEDYILDAGGIPEDLPQSRRSSSLGPSWQTSGNSSPAVGCFVALVFLTATIATFFSAPWFLAGAVLLGLCITALFVIRHYALKLKLGTVKLSIPHNVVASSEPWLAELRFCPPRNCRINSITLTLRADESTVSGSGSDRKNHRNTVFEQIIPLREREILAAGEVVCERLLMTFPKTTSLSIEAGANQLRWAALVRIDIPGFPDWVSTTPLQVLHPRFASLLPPDPELLPHWHQSIATAESPQHEAVPASSGTAAASQPDSNPATIATVLAELNSHSTHSSARASVIRRAIGQRVAVSVTINRSASTIGNSEEDPLYSNGLTVDGTLDGSRQTIRIIALASATPEIEGLPPNASWQAEVELIDWDTIYQRINARQLPAGNQ